MTERILGVRFKGGPLTYRHLSDAAVSLGADPDSVLEDPQSVFDDLEPTLPQYHRFAEIVCEPASVLYWRRRGMAWERLPWYLFWKRRKPDLLRTSAAAALALGRQLAADFWSVAWIESAASRPQKLLRYVTGAMSSPKTPDPDPDSSGPSPGVASSIS